MSNNSTNRAPARNEKLGLGGDSDRPDIRAEFRPDPSIVEAIREGDDAGDYFGFDASAKPSHMVYEGKRMTIAGMEDRKNQADMKRLGWTFVPFSRHPECPTDDPEKKIILRNGLALCERHEYYDNVARAKVERENDMLIGAQREKVQEEGNVLFPRKGGKLDAIAKIKREYAPMESQAIPE